ncbi:MAG TPA: O-phosphoserine--tRNA ligase [Methanobacteriales archaeon]|nr:O-phosphoserine--tRNA ligase [Methanobacteriaceae archaeon]HIH62029.1 O-phosphoserine--tRNA ligase [Methanobacteriales archaeon]
MKRKDIIKLARKDFEKAWVETGKLLKKTHHDLEYPRLRFKMGKSHILYDTIWRLRDAYLKLGFDEVVNPIFIDEEHIYKQFGPEAPAILDRCFYLAGLPRPDIGLGLEKIDEIKKLDVKIDDKKIDNLKEVFRSYKKGTIAGDDLVMEVSSALDVSDDIGLKVLERVFPEIRDLKPIPTKNTLRSHMTSGWFITLEYLHDKCKLPLKLFSIDRCFRREQREDPSHLMTYYSASCVIVDEEVTLDVGKAVAEGLLEYFGFSKFKFLPDEKKSKYYVPGTQTEVYGYHPKLKEWVEIATFGLYSPIALSKYGVDKDVMNLGLGVERLAMILAGEDDIRGMVYPHIYKEWELSDREIASMLRINLYPVTEDGRKLMDKIVDVWREHGDEPSPCSFTVYNGEFLGRNIKVEAVEVEENTRLLGPAVNNKIFIYDGNILGVPENEKLDTKLIKEAREKGIDTGISYMDALAAEAAYKIEEMVVTGSKTVKVRSAIARSLSDLNLILDKVGMRYITSKKKVIDLRGPTFSTIKARIR